MAAAETFERRVRPRRGISLPTLGLSLGELTLVLEVVPRGWTEGEATGLVRRIAREITARHLGAEELSSDQVEPWRTLIEATDEDVRSILNAGPKEESCHSPGDQILDAVVKRIKADVGQ